MVRQADYLKSMDFFAETIYKLSLSDRDINIGVGGFTGEGKSCFLTKLFKTYGKYSGVPWSFDLMTWSRKELLEWIDGKKNDKSNQKPEHTAILVDELFMLFYKRNWYDEGQIDSIATLNMCRDRHLLIGGNIPNFWDLDTAFTSRIRFYVYIPRRGIAWIFEQENNPFSTDLWNKNRNEKLFRKYKDPYLLSNFLCEIHYSDWSPNEKIAYYNIRNSKRLSAIDVNKKEKVERYSKIKNQRDILIRALLQKDKKLTSIDIGEMIDLSPSMVRYIKDGLR